MLYLAPLFRLGSPNTRFGYADDAAILAISLSLRWLGVLFDKKLSFKYHVGETTSKALIVATALRGLEHTVRGIKPHLMR